MTQVGRRYRIAKEMRGLSTDCTVQSLSVIPKGATVQVEGVFEMNRILTIRHQDCSLYIFQDDLRTFGVRIIGAASAR